MDWVKGVGLSGLGWVGWFNNNNNIYSYSKYRKQVHYRTKVRTCALNRT